MVFSKILRAGEGKILRRLKAISDAVNDYEHVVKGFSDAELRAQTDVFRTRLADGETLDDILVEAFAVGREAAWRTLGQRHFDVQVMGGAALHLGNIAEMKTGEGKTLTCVLPAYLNALEGNGVHVVTTNDYLVRVGAENMGRVHRFLGMTVGLILAPERPAQRRQLAVRDGHVRQVPVRRLDGATHAAQDPRVPQVCRWRCRHDLVLPSATFACSAAPSCRQLSRNHLW